MGNRQLKSQWDFVWKYLKIVDPEIRWSMIMFQVYFSSFGHALCFRHTQDRYGSELTSILGCSDTENDLRWGSIGAPRLSHSRNNYLLSIYIYIYANIYLTGLIRAIYSKGYTHPPEDSNKSITIITIQELDAKTGK